jgi:uncharacterized membrane protein YwzB
MFRILMSPALQFPLHFIFGCCKWWAVKDLNL